MDSNTEVGVKEMQIESMGSICLVIVQSVLSMVTYLWCP